MDLKRSHFAQPQPRALGRLGLALAVLALATTAPRLAQAEDVKGDPTYSGNQPIDQELDKYWNADQKVSSLLNPMYERKGGFEFALHLGAVPNDSFYFPKSVGGSIGFFLTDTLAIEAGFSYLFSSYSDLEAFLAAAPVSTTGSKDITANARKVPLMNWLSSADLVWSPFHGKIGIFASKLSNFDLSFAAGLGLINARVDTSDHSEATPGANLVSKIKPAAHWGATLRFYVLRWLQLRADYRQFLYQPDEYLASRPDWARPFLAPVEFTLGVAFLTK